MPAHVHKRLKYTPATDTPLALEPPETIEAEDITTSARSSQILQLPAELWLEIMSYFPAVPIPTQRVTRSPILPPSSRDRSDVLRYLSQTCHTLRDMFFEQAWERLEVCAIRAQRSNGQKSSEDYSIEGLNYRLDQIPGSWYLCVSRTLQTKCEGLSRYPEYAALVWQVLDEAKLKFNSKFILSSTVNVVLIRCSAKTVLPAFARCIEMLPNLHTLQILRAHSQLTTPLKKVFEGRSFPSIQTVILPTHAHEILCCCKDARVVVCNHGDGSQLLTAMAKGNKKVERLEGFMPGDRQAKRRSTPMIEHESHLFNLITGIVKIAPRLRVIKFVAPIPPVRFHFPL